MPNPFCGWCLYEQKCSLKHECIKKSIFASTSQFFQEEPSLNDSLWLRSVLSVNSSTNRCPSIISVRPSRYVNPISSIQNKPDNYIFALNVKLIPRVEYYCDITANIFQRSLATQQATLSRVPASFLNESTLRCDLMPIKVFTIFIIKMIILSFNH